MNLIKRHVSFRVESETRRQVEAQVDPWVLSCAWHLIALPIWSQIMAQVGNLVRRQVRQQVGTCS